MLEDWEEKLLCSLAPTIACATCDALAVGTVTGFTELGTLSITEPAAVGLMLVELEELDLACDVLRGLRLETLFPLLAALER